MRLRCRGRGRNSRCLLLLLTSASTAVKLDHCDASLRRSLNPGEELWSVSLMERAGKGWSVARRGGGEHDEEMSESAGSDSDRKPT